MYNKKRSKRLNSHFYLENKLIKILKSKRSQSAIEFVILTGVLIFFFTIFFIVLSESGSERTIQKQKMDVEDVAIAVQNEINLALESSDGYNRNFKVPEDINGRDYEINIIEGLIYIKTSDNKNAMALPVQNVTGNISKGDNKITKKEGIVYLN
jgi:hypothetical protein